MPSERKRLAERLPEFDFKDKVLTKPGKSGPGRRKKTTPMTKVETAIAKEVDAVIDINYPAPEGLQYPDFHLAMLNQAYDETPAKKRDEGQVIENTEMIFFAGSDRLHSFNTKHIQVRYILMAIEVKKQNDLTLTSLEIYYSKACAEQVTKKKSFDARRRYIHHWWQTPAEHHNLSELEIRIFAYTLARMKRELSQLQNAATDRMDHTPTAAEAEQRAFLERKLAKLETLLGSWDGLIEASDSTGGSFMDMFELAADLDEEVVLAHLRELPWEEAGVSKQEWFNEQNFEQDMIAEWNKAEAEGVDSEFKDTMTLLGGLDIDGKLDAMDES